MVTSSPFGRFVRRWWLDVLLLALALTTLMFSFLTPDGNEGDPVLALRLVALGCVTAWLLLRLPRWQVSGLHSESPSKRLESENEARRTLATILGGAALLASLYFTSVQLAEQRRQSDQQLKEQRARAAEERSLSEARLVTETYVKAVELLGAIDGADLGRKIGAIYALERVARTSEPLHRPIMELLQAYVRERSRLGGGPPGKVARAPADVQSAIIVMGRRNTTFDGNSGFLFDFSFLSLSHLNFDQLNFAYANFAGANVSSSTFKGTKLCGANFRGAEMGSVEIVDSDARLAYLEAPSYIIGTDLRGAIVVWPDPVRHIDGTFDSVGILAARDMTPSDAGRVKKGGGHFVDDASGTSEWREHMKQLLGAGGGAFGDGCGRLPTRVWTIVNDPAPTVFSK